MRQQLGGALVVGALLTVSCGGGDGEGVEESANEDHLARARAAAWFVEENLGRAREAMTPLIERADPEPEDLVRAAILAYEDQASGELDYAVELLRRAQEARPDWAVPPYAIGAYLAADYRLDEAVVALERAVELAPNDVPARYHLAGTYRELERTDEAAELYRALIDRGPDDVGAGWMKSILYRYSRILIETGEDDEYQAVYARWKELEDSEVEDPDLIAGNLAQIRFPTPIGTEVASAQGLTLGPVSGDGLELGPYEHLEARSLGGNFAPEEKELDEVVKPAVLNPPDLLAWGERGIAIARRGADAAWTATAVFEAAVELLGTIDWNDDGNLDLVLISGGAPVFLEGSGGSFERVELAHPELPAGPKDLTAVDMDHDGDQDLLWAGDFGARLWRNDGLAPPETSPGEAEEVVDPRFTDATADGALPTSAAFEWVAIEDFDHDQDVDLLFGSAAGSYLADNLRGGVFADRSAYLAGLASAVEPVVMDLNGDELADVWVPSSGEFFAGGAERMRREAGAPAASSSNHALIDVDLDGAFDVVGGSDAGLAGRQALGLPVEASFSIDAESASAGAWAVADFDGDANLESARLVDGRVVFADLQPAGRSIPFALEGDKDNHRGVGAIVEVLAGNTYQRIYWDGESRRLGLGRADRADIVRVTWPNGVVQHVLDAPPDQPIVMFQIERLAGSCPFLYSWNGETYTYVSDVLGITPLGLPMAPGQLVPFDHDEYVLVKGEQLEPREVDGRRVFDLQITEELREVTYLDQLRLLVVDHPDGTELQPNERFCFPPFPERHEHVVRDPLSPLRVTDAKGQDWTVALAVDDGDMAKPFDYYQGQFRGLAEPHFLEVEFDAAEIAHRDGERLRLMLTGWLFWTNASVNVAAARTGGTDFVPPILQVPDGDGGWVDAGPPVGFPAGKTKTMVLDVSDILRRDDPRVRVFCTLRLYWDSIRLAIGDDEETRITTLEPVAAELWDRGFSRPVFVSCTKSDESVASKQREQSLEWFDWDALEFDPPWNQHPGMYTKLGAVLPLLDEIDDRYVIMGAGDSLRVLFPADLAPPEEGWTRDYLLFLDGWAKDRDPNTLEALEVEPLPFHGMSGYPYPDTESFPDDEEHEAWRREWNTRPAKVWIPPLSGI